jgi:dihydroxyacetone kinase-like protein
MLMTQALTTSAIQAAIGRVLAKVETCQSELNTLDGQLGDGDLGVTLVNGFRRMAKSTGEFPEDVGMALMKCAQALTKAGGSSYATLLATGLMAAAKETRGQTEVPWSSMTTLLKAAEEKMRERGKSAIGDKTVIDAVDAARQAAAGTDDPAAMLEAVNAAISERIAGLRDAPCRQGRARIFSEKSRGLDDPGMLGFKRLVEGLGEKGMDR